MRLSKNLFEEIDNVGTFEKDNKGVAPTSYAAAVKEYRKKKDEAEKNCEKHRQDVFKGTDEMDSTDNSRFKHNVIKTKPLRQMHLSESLFEEWEDEADNTEDTAKGDQHRYQLNLTIPYSVQDFIDNGDIEVADVADELEIWLADEGFDEFVVDYTVSDRSIQIFELRKDDYEILKDRIRDMWDDYVEQLEADYPIDEEYIKKSLKEDLDQQALDNNGTAGILNNLIIDEFEAITGYNDAIVSIESTNPNCPILDVLKDILKEENIHVGQLQAALTKVSEAAHDIAEGTTEGHEQLNDDKVETEDSFGDKHIG